MSASSNEKQTRRIVEILEKTPLFHGLSEATIQRLARDASIYNSDRNAAIFLQGDPCIGLNIVISGEIKLCLELDSDHEKVIEFVRPGESFGLTLMIAGEPYMTTVRAITDCSLLFVPKQSIIARIDGEHELCHRILVMLASRVQQFITDIEAYSLHTGRMRVVDYLLRHVDADDENPPCASLSMHLTHSKKIAASRLNLTPEHFSRILKQLCDAGLIRLDKRTIYISDIARLRAEAHDAKPALAPHEERHSITSSD